MSTIEQLQAAVTQQSAIVRKLKQFEPSAEELADAIEELKLRKIALISAEKAQAALEPQVDRAKFENCMKRRFFYGASFSLYGGVAGLFDLGMNLYSYS